MSIFSALFNGLSRKKSRSSNDYVSDDDYNYVQGKFREILDAQQSGDDEKAQEIWDNFKDECKGRK